MTNYGTESPSTSACFERQSKPSPNINHREEDYKYSSKVETINMDDTPHIYTELDNAYSVHISSDEDKDEEKYKVYVISDDSENEGESNNYEIVSSATINNADDAAAATTNNADDVAAATTNNEDDVVMSNGEAEDVNHLHNVGANVIIDGTRHVARADIGTKRWRARH